MSRLLRIGLVGAVGLSALGALASPAIARSGHPLGVMLMSNQPASQPTTTTALTYRGGPVVSNAQVQVVSWGTGTYTASGAQLATFFGSILNSAYMSWLKEYDTPAPPTGTGQHIGYGTSLGSVAITPPSNATTIDDSTIQATLLNDVNAGLLAPPTLDAHGHVNTVYAVSFPTADTVTLQGGASGQTLCAYHNSTAGTDAEQGLHLLYEVIPDIGSPGMSGGCGANASAFNNETSYASHELIEVVTDPIVADGGPNAQEAWYNDSLGEIGDICNAQQATVATYVVQKEWSNSQNACIATRAATTPGTPGPVVASPQHDGTVRLSWTYPSDDGYSPVTNYEVYRGTSPGSLTAITSAPTTPSYVDSPGPDGQYYYAVDAVTAGGTSTPSTPVGTFLDTTKPTISMSAPSSLFSLASSATTKYLGHDAGTGVASYDVSYRVAKWNGGFGTAVKPSGWQHTSATHETTSVSLGHEYCFTAVARDGGGNLSTASSQHCQVAPLDERSFSRSAHWSTSSSSSAYQHTLTTTTTKGATLTLKGVRAHRLALVLQSCAKCGHVKVYVGKTLIATVDTHSATTRNKVVKILSAFSLRTADVRLVAADTGKRVVVDGVGVSLT